MPPTTQSNDGWTSLGNQSWTVAVANTAGTATGIGSVSVPMASLANLAVGQAVSGPGIAPGSIVSALGSGAITLSVPLTAVLPAAAKLSFGSGASSASPAETYRRAYNGYLRQHASALGCSGVIDPDSVFADQGGSGKWRVDLGAASADGVHPASALHQAAVNAGLITPAMFQAP